MSLSRWLAVALATCLVPVHAAAAQERALSAHEQQAEDLFRELIEYRTSEAYPEVTLAALESIAARLHDAGFPATDVVIIHPEPAPQLSGLVARYRGTGARPPLMAMAHIDVVDAEPSAWAFDPFTFGKSDGYYYGRGTTDNKAGVVSLVSNFVRLRQEGFVPDRDLIMVLTGDEETDGVVIDWLVNQRRDLIEAEVALNTDAGGGVYDPNGEPQIFYVQTSEKVYQTFRFTTTNPGGHSSVPRPDNAIYQLAAALERLAAYRFPIRLNDGTRAYFERSAQFHHGDAGTDMQAIAGDTVDLEAAERIAARSPYWNSTLRTSCVATRLQAGHADNALPRSATATVNCRIFPGVPVDEVEAMLRQVVDDEGVVVSRVRDAVPSPPTSITPEQAAILEELVGEMWPDVPVIPEMSTGATDGLYVRNGGIPVLGVSAIFEPPDDMRAHGLDERVGIEEFHRAVEFWYRMLRRLAS